MTKLVNYRLYIPLVFLSSIYALPVLSFNNYHDHWIAYYLKSVVLQLILKDNLNALPYTLGTLTIAMSKLKICLHVICYIICYIIVVAVVVVVARHSFDQTLASIRFA